MVSDVGLAPNHPKSKNKGFAPPLHTDFADHYRQQQLRQDYKLPPLPQIPKHPGGPVIYMMGSAPTVPKVPTCKTQCPTAPDMEELMRAVAPKESVRKQKKPAEGFFDPLAQYRAEKDRQTALRELGEQIAAIQLDAENAETQPVPEKAVELQEAVEARETPPAPRREPEVTVPDTKRSAADSLETAPTDVASSGNAAKLVKFGLAFAGVQLAMVSLLAGAWYVRRNRQEGSQTSRKR